LFQAPHHLGAELLVTALFELGELMFLLIASTFLLGTPTVLLGPLTA